MSPNELASLVHVDRVFEYPGLDMYVCVVCGDNPVQAAEPPYRDLLLQTHFHLICV